MFKVPQVQSNPTPTNLFTNSQTPSVSNSSSVFKVPQTQSSPTPPTLFANSQTPTSSSHLFGASPQSTNTGLFGRVEKPATFPGLFASNEQPSSSAPNTTNMFHSFQPPSQPNFRQTRDTDNISLQTSNPALSIFGSPAVSGPLVPNKNCFGQPILPQTGNASSKETQKPKEPLFNQAALEAFTQDSVRDFRNGTTPGNTEKAAKELRAGSKRTYDESTKDLEGFTEEEKNQVTTGVRLRDFDAYISKRLRTNPPRSELILLKKFYHETTTAIIRANGGTVKRPQTILKRKNDEEHAERKRTRTQSPRAATKETVVPEIENPSQTSNLFKGVLDNKGQEEGSHPQPPVNQSEPSLSSNTVAAPVFKVPTFGAGTATNFMAQFGKAADKTAEEAKAKRKAEEYDSDEEDEATWERKYEEEQRSKKQKLAESIKASKTKLVNGKFELVTASEGGSSGSTASQEKSKASTTSVFDQPHQPLPPAQNIFGHLINSATRADGGSTGKGQNQDKEEEGDDAGEDGENEGDGHKANGQNAKSADAGSNAEPKSRSLFDRISKDAHGNPIRELPKSDTTPTSQARPFSQSSNIFGAPPASVPTSFFAPSDNGHSSSATDKATTPVKPPIFGQAPSTAPTEKKKTWQWTADKPIKFGSQLNPITADVMSSSPSKSSLSGLFGAAKNQVTTDSPAKPATDASITSPPKPGAAPLGFGFTAPNRTASLLAAPSNPASAETSRATSPGLTTGESANESNAENDDKAPKEAQLDLMSSVVGEENEECLFEVKAKAHVFDNETKIWAVKGLGPLRVLKHKETGLVRVVLRAIPSGKIVINTPLFPNLTYEKPRTNSVMAPVADENGNVATWLFKIGSIANATALLNVLKENVPN